MNFIFNDKLYERYLLNKNDFIVSNLKNTNNQNIYICEYYNEQDKYYSKEYVYIDNNSNNKNMYLSNIICIIQNKMVLSKELIHFIVRKNILYKVIEDISSKSFLSGYNVIMINKNITKNIYIDNTEKTEFKQPQWYKGNAYLLS